SPPSDVVVAPQVAPCRTRVLIGGWKLRRGSLTGRTRASASTATSGGLAGFVVGWTPCDCPAALTEPGEGHLRVHCATESCQSTWYWPRHSATWAPGVRH